MEDKKIAVFGLYQNRLQAERGVDDLIAASFRNDAISVLLPDAATSRDFAHEKHTKAPEGTTVGVTAGGVIGGTLGLLAGLGTIAIPGIGPFLAAGPIVTALAGLGAGGAVGGVIGALAGLGIPEYEAKRYEGHIKAGGILLSVHCSTTAESTRAKEILRHNGAQDISATGESTADTPALQETNHG